MFCEKGAVSLDTYRYVIVGGGIASQRACDGIRREDGEGSVALVTQEEFLPYERPPLSKEYLVGTVGLDKVILQDKSYYEASRVDLFPGVRASTLDAGQQQLTLSNGRTLKYEKLLLATGGSPRRLLLPGSKLGGIHTLRSIRDADAIRAAAGDGQSAAVLGGSFIGSEVAAALTALGVEVTMVFPESRLLERLLPEPMGVLLTDKYRARGVTIRSSSKPQRFSGEQTVSRVELEGGDSLNVDMVVMGVGIRLNTELAVAAGLAMTDRGAVLVDEHLQTSDPRVFAAGDIASWPDPTFGKRLRVEHWDVARSQGLRAGRNMAGNPRPYTTLPYFFSDLFDFSIEVWGDLTRWEKTVVRGEPAEGGFALFYFDEGRLVGALSAGRPSGERKPMQSLVRARPMYESIASLVSDEGVDLTTLLQ